MSVKSKKTQKSENFFNTDKFNYLIAFSGVYLIAYLIVNEIVIDIIAQNIFLDDTFKQFSLFNIINYLLIFLVLALIPYISMFFITFLILMVFSSTGSRKYDIRKIFLFTLLIFTLSIILHFVIVKIYVDRNLSFIYSNIQENVQYILNVQTQLFLSGETIEFNVEGLGGVVSSIFIDMYYTNEDLISFLGFYLVTRSYPSGSNPQLEFLISNDLFFILIYFIIAFFIAFDRLFLPCDCEINIKRISKMKSKKTLNVCSKNQFYTFLFIILIASLPIINIVQVFVNLSQNHVDWEKYYDYENTDNQFYVSNNETNSILYNETIDISIKEIFNNRYNVITKAELPLQIDYKDNSESLLVQRLHTFDTPQFINTISFNEFLLISNFSIINYPIYINNYGVILSNESEFWENFEYYYYFLDENYQGYGYKITNDSSISTNDYEEIELYDNNLDQNISFKSYSVMFSGVSDPLYEDGTTFIKTKPAVFDIFNGMTIALADPPLDELDSPSFIQFHNLKGVFNFEENIKYIGYSIELKEDIFLDFDNNSYNNLLEFNDNGIFAGNKRLFDLVLNEIIVTDVIMFSSFLFVIIIFQYLDFRNKDFKENVIKCDMRKKAFKFERKYKLK